MSPLLTTVLLVALLPSPGVLMFAAHVYALRSQDERQGYVVVLGSDTPSPDAVIDEHARIRGVEVGRRFGASIPGYSAILTVRAANRLRRDQRVRLLERQESDEFELPTGKVRRRS